MGGGGGYCWPSLRGRRIWCRFSSWGRSVTTGCSGPLRHHHFGHRRDTCGPPSSEHLPSAPQSPRHNQRTFRSFPAPDAPCPHRHLQSPAGPLALHRMAQRPHPPPPPPPLWGIPRPTRRSGGPQTRGHGPRAAGARGAWPAAGGTGTRPRAQQRPRAHRRTARGVGPGWTTGPQAPPCAPAAPTRAAMPRRPTPEQPPPPGGPGGRSPRAEAVRRTAAQRKSDGGRRRMMGWPVPDQRHVLGGRTRANPHTACVRASLAFGGGGGAMGLSPTRTSGASPGPGPPVTPLVCTPDEFVRSLPSTSDRAPLSRGSVHSRERAALSPDRALKANPSRCRSLPQYRVGWGRFDGCGHRVGALPGGRRLLGSGRQLPPQLTVGRRPLGGGGGGQG